MEEIGNLFLLTREAAGLSLKEVSEDLEIEQVVLENIEDGKSGAFPDVFILKEYVFDYAKYLGLDADKIVDEFNEYVFEATSKIPIKEIEKKIVQTKKETDEEKVISPYTKQKNKNNNWLYLIIYCLIVLLIIVAVFWSIKQVTIDTQIATTIGIGK